MNGLKQRGCLGSSLKVTQALGALVWVSKLPCPVLIALRDSRRDYFTESENEGVLSAASPASPPQPAVIKLYGVPSTLSPFSPPRRVYGKYRGTPALPAAGLRVHIAQFGPRVRGEWRRGRCPAPQRKAPSACKAKCSRWWRWWRGRAGGCSDPKATARWGSAPASSL